MHGQSVERGHALLVDDLRRAVLPECLVLQHEGLRREVKRVIGEVRRHQDADALRVEAQDETQEAVRVAEVEVRRWLVEDEELRLLRERRREQDELMLAARDVRIGLLREMSDAPPQPMMPEILTTSAVTRVAARMMTARSRRTVTSIDGASCSPMPRMLMRQR